MSKKSQKSGQKQQPPSQQAERAKATSKQTAPDPQPLREPRNHSHQQQQQQPSKSATEGCDSGAKRARAGDKSQLSKLAALSEERARQQANPKRPKLQPRLGDSAAAEKFSSRIKGSGGGGGGGVNNNNINKSAMFAANLQPAQSAPAASPNQTAAANTLNEPNICAACQKPIKERYLLMALDKRWHEDCLKCACCDCRLGEVGSSLFTHSDKLLCRRDFLRIFGRQGHCAACRRPIPPYELVMRAQDKAYHMDCFACQRCQYRFCVGDRFQLTDTHKIICLLCHGEQHRDPEPQQPQQQRQQQPQQRDQGPTLALAEAPPATAMAMAMEATLPERTGLSATFANLEPDQLPAAAHQLGAGPLEPAPAPPPPPPPLEQAAAAGASCPVQQMRLPGQQEQERACVM